MRSAWHGLASGTPTPIGASWYSFQAGFSLTAAEFGSLRYRDSHTCMHTGSHTPGSVSEAQEKSQLMGWGPNCHHLSPEESGQQQQSLPCAWLATAGGTDLALP